MQLTEQQNKVLDQIVAFMRSDAQVFILRGYAGTGKTTMVKVIADFIAETRSVALMAPTGRAARVLAQKAGRSAATIHKTIYGACRMKADGGKDDAAADFKLVFPVRECAEGGRIMAIIDEASMVCSRTVTQELYVFGTDNLMEDLLTWVRPAFGGKLIFVGDPAQLPPVGEPVSNALRAEFFQEKGLRVMEAELTEVLRQKGGSVILKNAMMIRDLLQKSRRNNLVFDEQAGDVETVAPEQFLDRYISCRKEQSVPDSVLICYSNKSATGYNRDVRAALYGADEPIRESDVLQVVQNNYCLNLMNGEFVKVVSVGERELQSAPVYVQKGAAKEKVLIELKFVRVKVACDDGVGMSCLLLEDLLTSDKPNLAVDEAKALYINFRMRHPKLKEGTEIFAATLMQDEYFNALRAKYGYAVTGHKCQGGEWDSVFVDYTGRTGLSDDCLRWAYTATTRARNTLYVTNLPHVTPFSKFKIESVQKCSKMPAECRVFDNVAATPFHNLSVEPGVRAKYHCIAQNLEYSPYSIHSVVSKPYLEIYNIQTPDGVDRYDLIYKAGAIFQKAKAASPNEHTALVSTMLDSEQAMPLRFNYQPSDPLLENIYSLMRSACDTVGVQITNVVENLKAYNVVYYMRTCGSFSYILIYVNAGGFVTHAQPMSLLGAADEELAAVVGEIKSRMM